MNVTEVIIKALLTEKAHAQMAKSTYAFLVNKKANKQDVKNAVKSAFSVDVVNVNIISIKPKQKRIAKTRKFTMVGGGKKAIVYLKAGQTISVLSPTTETKEKKVKSKSAEKDVQKVKVEGKEGA